MTAKYLDRIAAAQRAELYYDLHPASPSAVRSPRLFKRGALRAFDEQYINALRPPAENPAT